MTTKSYASIAEQNDADQAKSTRVLPNDEITLIDIVMFFQRIRNFLLAGLILGAIAGGAGILLVGRLNYLTQIYLYADYSISPAMQDATKILAIFKDRFTSTRGIETIYEVLSQESARFKKSLDDNKIEKELFIYSLIQPSSKLYFKLENGTAQNEFRFTIRLPANGLEESAPHFITKALNAIGQEYNDFIVYNYNLRRSAILSIAKKNIDETSSAFSKNALSIQDSIQGYRQRLFDIEYKLYMKLLESDYKKYSNFLYDNNNSNTIKDKYILPVQKESDSYHISSLDLIGNDYMRLLQNDFDRLTKSAIVLKEQRMFTKEEADAILKDISIIQSNVAALEKGEQVTEARIALEASYSHLQRFREIAKDTLDLSQVLLPMFKVNESLLPGKNKILPLEKKDSNYLKILMIGLLIGLASGFCLGVFYLFYKRYLQMTHSMNLK